jgi:2-phospho-L-lactate transferase/gluconeogenesis factor (CofD/UPF0052 family)
MSESISTIQETTMPNGLAMPGQFSELQTVIADMVQSANKYGQKPTKVEATRLRKHLMALAKKCKESRQCVLQNVKSMPKIPRTAKKQPVDEQRQTEFAEEASEEVVNEGGLKVKKPRKSKKKE